MLGLAPVRQAFADKMTEVTVGYSNSPLNGPALNDGPPPGARRVPVAEETPIGSGTAPRFALCAAPSSATAGLIKRFPDVLDPELRTPIREDSFWLLRPDGYVACGTAAGNERVIEHYLAERL